MGFQWGDKFAPLFFYTEKNRRLVQAVFDKNLVRLFLKLNNREYIILAR